MEYLWPSIALAVLGFGAFFIFRKQIGKLIDRTTHIDKSGIKASPQDSAVTQDQRPLARDLMESGHNQVIRDQEAKIRDSLKKVVFSSAEEKEALLVRALASSEVFARFERLSDVIYGSQLNILVHASSQPAGFGEHVVIETFEHIKKSEPGFHEETTYEAFKGFLVNTGLLEWNKESLRLTLFGREFLKYLVDRSLTFQRRG